MRLLFTLILVAGISACAELRPKTVTSSDLDVQGALIFKSSVDKTFDAIKGVISEKKWKLLYEGDEPPKQDYGYFSNQDPFSTESYDRIAWDRSLSSTMAPKKFLQAKTPTSAFSYGAEIFVTLFESPDKGTVVSVSTSTSQIIEKDKLETYINEFAQSLNEKVD